MSYRDRGPMLDRRIIAFDIESQPDADAGRRIQGLSGGDELVSERMLRERLQQTDGQSDFLKLAFHRVVVVSMAELDPQAESFVLDSPAQMAAEEKPHLEGFFNRFQDFHEPIRLVSWNGEGFDLPVLRYRGMMNGISAPGFCQSETLEHFDLMVVLAGSSRWMRLDEWCRLIRLPGKTLTKGDQVYRHVFAGEVELVRDYCELDTCNTLLAFLLLAFHRGELPLPRLRQFVESIADGLRRQGGEAKTAFAEGLRGWPRF